MPDIQDCQCLLGRPGTLRSAGTASAAHSPARLAATLCNTVLGSLG